MNLIDFLTSHVDFTSDEVDTILDQFSKEEMGKNQLLVREGQVCRKLYFIERGLGRSYYLRGDGKDVTQWFFGSGAFMSSADSFFNQLPSYYYLQTLEDSTVYSITHEKMEALLSKYHRMERFVRLLSIEILTDVVRKVNAIQFQTARERYDYMISEFPNIVHQVPLGHIASYLGMTQETLSRIRNSGRKEL